MIKVKIDEKGEICYEMKSIGMQTEFCQTMLPILHLTQTKEMQNANMSKFYKIKIILFGISYK